MQLLCCFDVLIVGEAHSLKVEKVLFKDKSEYQEVLVFEVRKIACFVRLCVFFFCNVYAFQDDISFLFFCFCSQLPTGKCLF